MGTDMIEKTSIVNHTAFGLDGTVEARTSSKDIGQCSVTCACCCHSKRRMHIAHALSYITGFICIIYVGGDTNRACDHSSCRRKLLATLNLTYYFPPWLLTKAMSIFLRFDPAGGMNMTLRMPNVCPDTSTIFHLATAGDVGGMKALFEKDLASPNDVSCSFGYSVVHVSCVPCQYSPFD
jgi:hypothetical protein